MAIKKPGTEVKLKKMGHPSASAMSKPKKAAYKEEHRASPTAKLHKTGAKKLVGKMADGPGTNNAPHHAAAVAKHHAEKAVEHHEELMHHHKMIAHHSKKMAHHAKHAGKHHKAK
jgi:hypothetical protein